MFSASLALRLSLRGLLPRLVLQYDSWADHSLHVRVTVCLPPNLFRPRPRGLSWLPTAVRFLQWTLDLGNISQPRIIYDQIAELTYSTPTFQCSISCLVLFSIFHHTNLRAALSMLPLTLTVWNKRQLRLAPHMLYRFSEHPTSQKTYRKPQISYRRDRRKQLLLLRHFRHRSLGSQF